MGINEVSEILRIVTAIGKIAVGNGKDYPPARGAKVGAEYPATFLFSLRMEQPRRGNTPRDQRHGG